MLGLTGGDVGSVLVVGRDEEMAALRRWSAEAAGGRGRLVLCSGEPGVGKTRLAAALAADVRSAGAVAAWGHCLDGDGSVAFRPWLDVLRPLAARQPLPPAGLEGLLEDPARRSVPAHGPPLGGEARERAFDAVVVLLRAAGEAGGALVVLDDIHLADKPSLVLLAYLARRVGELPVLLLATHRDPGPGSGLSEVLPELLRGTATERLPLRGLGPEAVGRLLAAVTGRPASAADTARVHRITGGNPFFVAELAREWVAAGGAIGGAVPATVREAVWARLNRLHPTAREVLQVAAIIGEQFPDGLVASAVGRSALVCLPALDEAAEAGLVRPAGLAGAHGFVHALVRDAVEEGMGSVARVRWHGAVAEAIERYYAADLASHLSDLARHRVIAAPTTPDGVDQAVRWCQRAADDALVRLAWEEAARLYGTALDMGGQLGWDDRRRLLLGRARARFWSAELAGALDDSLEAARLARSAGRGDLVAEAALVLQAVGDPELLAPVRDLCEEALATPDLAPELRARLLAQVALACFYLDPDRIDEASAAALAAAEASQDADVIAAALRTRQLARSGPDGVADRLALAGQMTGLGRRCRRPDLTMWGHLWRIDAHVQRGDLAAVARELGGLGSCASRAGGTAAAWHLLRAQALLAQAEARFHDALALGRQARAQMALLHPEFAEPIWLNFQLVVGRHLGVDPAVVHQRDAAQGFSGVASPLSRAGQAAAWAALGDLDAARASYRRWPPMVTWHPPRYLFDQLTSLRLYDAVAIGHREDLVALVDRLAGLRGHHIGAGAGGPFYGGPVVLLLAHAEQALGRVDAAVSDLRAALDATRANGARGFAIEAGTLLAEVLAQRGAPGDAAQAADLAVAAASDARLLGMVPWAARAEQVAANLHPTGTALGPLTAREEQVAELVSRGLTNRAIAEALVVSERTAQNHVQHILTKLGFSARSQIAAWVVSRRQTDK
ncbi:MAG TPA: AAA family ATPase [Actinomycetes bacterium]|nr:AAA family ATPase [Actinomycetes bacterium]